MASNQTYSSTELSGQVTKSLKDVSHYITASAGGWPNYKVGYLCSYDFNIQDGLPKLYEFNTNIACYYDAPLTPKVNALTDYFSNQGVDTLHVVGIKYSDNLTNPSNAFYNHLSSSCSQNNISSSFILESTEPDFDLPPEHAIQSGSNVYTLFVNTPFRYSEFDALVSGSYSKKDFRDILSNSPSSSLMIGEFDPTSYTPNNDYPDYIAKIDEKDATLLKGNCRFYTYESSHYTALSSSLSSSFDMYEKYVIGSGSNPSSGTYNYSYTYSLLHSHDGLVDLGCESVSHKLIPSSSSDTKRWDIIADLEFRHIVATGSQIEMYDNSKKEVGSLQVGDVVKSVNVPSLNSQNDEYRNWSSSSLSGNITGSKVTRIISKTIPAYYRLNDNYILPDNISRVMNVSGSSTYKFDTPCELDTTRKLIKKTADNNFNLLDVISSDYVVEDKVFYAVELEGDDIFYSDDLLVHS